ncbi:MAG: hypothetical protein ACOC1K_02375 [Nanoarchaeota archaeon]
MTSLIKLQKRNLVQFENDKVEIIDFVLTPNGVSDPKLVCVVYAKRLRNGNIVSATSENFKPLEDVEYEEFYPSVHLNSLS